MKAKPSKLGENRLRKRAAGTRKRLKYAALDIFSGKSLHAVTDEDITEKAGFVFGFFSFAIIGMTSKEIEISILLKKSLTRTHLTNGRSNRQWKD